MNKVKLYKIEDGYVRNDKDDLTKFIVGIFVYAIVLMIATSIFRGIYVENFLYALVAALILSCLNYTIKPILIYWTLPLNIVTFGISYPIVNIIILKLCDILMGNSFATGGFFSTFFVAIFISALKMFLDSLITKRVGRR
jgi:putative membrane protein